jgi:hypothetical protein
MHWMPLTIFLAVMLLAYYVADKLDKLEERNSKHRNRAGSKR